MTKEKVDVIIDSNEASQKPKLVEALTLHEDVEDYFIEPLDEGDIEIEGMLFERKTPSDFASSLQKGRLRDQVERMAGHEKRPFVLIEGNMEDFDELKHSDIPSKSLRGMDASIEMKNGVGVKYCSNIYKLADMAVRLARKSKEDVNTVEARQTDAIKDVSFMEGVFLSIEGVGMKKAERLSMQFPNLIDLVDATGDELQKVDGVGGKLAEEIINTVHSSNNTESTEEQQRVYKI